MATRSSLARLTQVLVGAHHPHALPIRRLKGQPEVHAAHAIMQGLRLRGRARWRGWHAPLLLLQAPLLLQGPWLSPCKLHEAGWLLRGLLGGDPTAGLKPILLLLLLPLLPLLLLLKLP